MKKIMFILTILSSLWILISCTNQTPDIQIELNKSLDTIEIGSDYFDYGAKAYYGLINLEVEVIENNIDTFQLGTYYIIYQARYNSISKTVKRVITVVDQTKPVITLNPGIDTIMLGELWIDEGVEVFDNSNQEVVVNIYGEVMNEIGEYKITYEAIDPSLNKSYLIRYVHVIENNG
jgi:hypothetical protein